MNSPHNMIGLRWKKIIRDLWMNRGRSLLVVSAITVGMVGVSAVLCAYSILVRELDANYMRTNPASAIIVTDAVDDNLLKTVQRLPGVGSVEARGLFKARVMVDQDEWKPFLLHVIDDFDAMRIRKSKRGQGDWPPRTGDILIERVALRVARKSIGDNVNVCLPGGSERKLRISGTLHDPGEAPAWMEGLVYGYVSSETLRMLGKTSLNEILLTVAETPLDKNHIRTTVKSITNRMEGMGYRIERIEIPEPGHHPHQSQLQALLFLLQAFGGLSFVLSVVLVFTLMGATMTQQVRQIGVMKAIGGRTGQMAGMYLGGALFLGAIAVAVGLPAGVAGARAYAAFAARMLNFEIVDASVPFWTYGLLVLIGLLAPVASAAYPVWKGSRVSVREAITDYGITASKTKGGWIGKVIAQSTGLSRPLLLSLRNTFRRKGRIALTLGTLAIGGAMFITALNVGASIKKTINTFRDAMRYDLNVTLSRPILPADVEPVVKKVPGVVRMEGWARAKASLVYGDGTDGNEFTVMAPPPETNLLRPRIAKGRWLSPDDRNDLVVNHIFMDRESHLRIGDEVVLRIGTEKTKWRIVGVMRQIGEPRGFANPAYLSDLTRSKGLVGTLSIVTHDRTLDTHRAAAKGLERALAEAGMGVQDMVSIYDIQRILEDHFLVLTMLLLIMSGLIVIVGGLGLMTTMSIQVMERTREIGVMRAIGASSHDLMRMIGIEALVIGLLSWGIAVVLAVPLSKVVADLFGMIFLKTTLDFAVSPVAFVLWLGVVVIFSMLASFFPTRKAIRLTVRETLAYE
jgi:putative ABC transport system permease protein